MTLFLFRASSGMLCAAMKLRFTLAALLLVSPATLHAGEPPDLNPRLHSRDHRSVFPYSLPASNVTAPSLPTRNRPSVTR
jgi:hypothetical protein